MRAPTPLKPLDIVILVALVEWEEDISTQAALAEALQLPQATLSRGLVRLRDSTLIAEMHGGLTPLVTNVAEFLIHGVKYAFPAYIGSPSRGIPTAHSAPCLSEYFASSEKYVWPSSFGGSRGTSVTPLHEHVPPLSNIYEELYEWFALLDTLRVGHVREKEIAERLILHKLGIEE